MRTPLLPGCLAIVLSATVASGARRPPDPERQIARGFSNLTIAAVKRGRAAGVSKADLHKWDRDMWGRYTTKALPKVDDVIVRDADETFPIHVGPSRTVVLAKRADEVEHRINLPGLGLARRALGPKLTYRNPGTIETLDDLVIDLLDHASADSHRSFKRGLRLASLAESGQYWHLGGMPEGGYPGPLPVEPETDATRTRVLQGQPIVRTGPRGFDEIQQRNYLVGFRREEGTYYDTPEGDLRKAGLAPRVKTVRTMYADGRPGQIVWRGAFVKRNLGPSGKFTRRDEAQVELAHTSTDAEAEAHLDALLVEAGVPADVRARVRPVIDVRTRRAAIALMDDMNRKIGFLVVDRYTTRGRGARGGKAGAPVVQFEVELLPEGKALYRDEPAEIDAFLDGLAAAYGGTVSPRPKAWAGMDDLDASPSASAR